MMFSDVVLNLRDLYQELWFYTGTNNPNSDVIKPWCWTYAVIVSPGGRRLASQVGSENEWEFDCGYQSPDWPPLNGGPNGCIVLTDLRFTQAVHEIMS